MEAAVLERPKARKVAPRPERNQYPYSRYRTREASDRYCRRCSG